MISILLLSSDRDEAEVLRQELRGLSALYTDERSEFTLHSSEFGTEDALAGIDILHMALIDMTMAGGVAAAREIRQRNPECQILVIADGTVSPMQYLTPDIRPSALLMRPYDPIRDRRVLEEFFFLTVRPSDDSREQYYWAKTRDGTQRIPYSSILYFEAREKRVFVRTRTVEYGTGGTIEKLMEELPGSFVRCHRSFIINRNYLERVRLAEGFAYLAGAVTVPISRSYRADFKELIHGIRTT